MSGLALPTAAGAKGRFRLGLFAVVLMLFFAVAPFVAPAPARAAGSLDARRLADQSKLAVEMIEADFTAEVSVPEPVLEQGAWSALQTRITDQVSSGALPSDEGSIFNAILAAIVADPLRYLVPGTNVATRQAGFSAIGSGFIVTPDGYMVTNAHVAAPNADETKAQLAQQGLKDAMDEEATSLASSEGATLTAQQTEALLGAVATYYLKYIQVGTVQRSVYAMAGISIPGLGTGSKGVPAEVVVAGEEIPGKDVAVLKVEGSTNLPTLPLGDDTTVNTGDRLYTMGFPGAATFHPLLTEASRVEPTLTSGLLSAKKQVEQGFTVLQTDASTTHGNSGGPAFDSQGRVIGIVTFGSIDANTGQEVQGLNFIVPITVVREFLSRSNVKPAESLTTKKYNQGLDAFAASRYKKALKLFQEVNGLYPGHPEVQKFITDSQTAISQGKDKGSSKTGLYAAVGVGVVVLVVLGTGLAFFLSRRRRGTGAPEPPTSAEAFPSPAGPTIVPPPYAATPPMPSAPPAPAVPPPGGAATGAPSMTGGGQATATLEMPPSPGSEEHFCSQCGAVRHPGDHFCAVCGSHFV